jgi:hypothetical protein
MGCDVHRYDSDENSAIEFGSVTQVQQILRKQAGFPWLESTVRDIGGAFRYFLRNGWFFAAAVVILALGIGATTAVFSVAETLLLRPLSYPESERLVTLRSVDMMSDYASTRAAALNRTAPPSRDSLRATSRQGACRRDPGTEQSEPTRISCERWRKICWESLLVSSTVWKDWTT